MRTFLSREINNNNADELDNFLKDLGNFGTTPYHNNIVPVTNTMVNDDLYKKPYNEISDTASDEILQFRQNKINDRVKLIQDINEMLTMEVNDESNFYTRRYVDSIRMILLCIEETDHYIDQASEMIDTLRNIRGKGSSMTMNEQGKIRASLMSNKLQLIKEYNAVKKTISDLELKQIKNKKDEVQGESANSEVIIGQLLNKILSDDVSGGIKESTAVATQNEVARITNGQSNQVDMIDSMATKYIPKGETKPVLPIDYSMSKLNLDMGVNHNEFIPNNHYTMDQYQSPTDSNAISQSQLNMFKYEATGYNIAIIYTDKNDWDYVAVDNNGEILPDAEVPNKLVNVPRFNFEINKAFDKVGREYVIYYKK